MDNKVLEIFCLGCSCLYFKKKACVRFTWLIYDLMYWEQLGTPSFMQSDIVKRPYQLAVNLEAGKIFHPQKQNYTGPSILYLFHSTLSNAIKKMWLELSSSVACHRY